MIRSFVFILTLGVGATNVAAQDEPYRVANGDIVDVTVFRVPELSIQAPIDIEGRLAFPLLGRVDVAGYTIDEIQELLIQRLRSEGVIENGEVTVALAEARPYIVGGVVAQPGAYPYRPDLTVRQAVALAGGLDASRYRSADDTVSERADLAMERQEAQLQLAELQLRIRRLQAEAAAYSGVDAVGPWPEGDSAGSAVLGERALLSFQIDAFEADRDHLERSSQLVRSRIENLETQMALHDETVNMRKAEFDRIEQMRERGLTSEAVVDDSFLALNQAQLRLSDLSGEINEARARLEDLTFDLRRLPQRRQQEVVSEQTQLQSDARALAQRIATLDRRIGVVPTESSVEYALHRTMNGRVVTRTVTDTFILGPDDMITVTVPPSSNSIPTD